MGAIERIERELIALTEAIAKIAAEFRTIYEGYLAALGQATKQQLILAGYHICTQGYPESFIELSFNQRQTLQRSLRELGSRAQEQLRLLLHQEKEDLDNPEVEENTGELPSISSSLLPPSSLPNLSAVVVEYNPTQPRIPNVQPQTPDSLVEWQENLEKRILKTLKILSRDANRLLQQSGILPGKLPEPILEAASKAEAPDDAIAGPPNLLNLIVETEELENSASTSLHIIAINLRLSEIEFGDASVTAWRHQIRNLSARLSSLRRDYQKKQRERAVAEAESAWHSCWFEE